MRRDSVGHPLPLSVLSYSNVFMSTILRCVPDVSGHHRSANTGGVREPVVMAEQHT